MGGHATMGNEQIYIKFICLISSLILSVDLYEHSKQAVMHVIKPVYFLWTFLFSKTKQYSEHSNIK